MPKARGVRVAPGVYQLIAPRPGVAGKFELRLKIACSRTGKQRDTSETIEAPSVRKASLERARLLEELSNKKPSKERIRFREYFERWIARKRRKAAPTTIAQYQTRARTLLDAIGDLRIDEITRDDLACWRDRLIEQNTSASDITNRVTLCKMVWKSLANDFELHDKAATLKPEVEIVSPPKVIEPEHVALLIRRLHALAPQWRAFTLCLADTGARIGEVCALRWDAIDFGRNLITIRLNVARHREIHRTKGKRARPQGMSEELRLLLLSHKAAQNPESPWVFPHPDEGKILPEDVWPPEATITPGMTLRSLVGQPRPLNGEYYRSKVWRPLVTAGDGLMPGVTPHWLRHSWNDLARQVSDDSALRLEVMGHVEERVNLRYTDVKAQEVVDLARKVTARYRGGESVGTRPLAESVSSDKE